MPVMTPKRFKGLTYQRQNKYHDQLESQIFRHLYFTSLFIMLVHCCILTILKKSIFGFYLYNWTVFDNRLILYPLVD